MQTLEVTTAANHSSGHNTFNRQVNNSQYILVATQYLHFIELQLTDHWNTKTISTVTVWTLEVTMAVRKFTQSQKFIVVLQGIQSNIFCACRHELINTFVFFTAMPIPLPCVCVCVCVCVCSSLQLQAKP